MNTIEVILSRRSIRKYRNTPVEQGKIDTILKAAMYAPSARNEQSWQFIVVDDKILLEKLATVHPYAKMLLEAPLAILVCGDESLEQTAGYWVQNCSAATQNILLAAHSLGLGAVWLGVYPREERISALSELFSLPAYIHPVSLIAIGYPDEIKETPERFKSDRIHMNAW